MPKIKYRLSLTAQEREELNAIVTKGRHSSHKVLNALILLNCNEQAPTRRALNLKLSPHNTFHAQQYIQVFAGDAFQDEVAVQVALAAIYEDEFIFTPLVTGLVIKKIRIKGAMVNSKNFQPGTPKPINNINFFDWEQPDPCADVITFSAHARIVLHNFERSKKLVIDGISVLRIVGLGIIEPNFI